VITVGLKSQSTQGTSKSLTMVLTKDGFVEIAKKKLLILKKCSKILLEAIRLNFFIFSFTEI
jgi:hypothetical protein